MRRRSVHSSVGSRRYTVYVQIPIHGTSSSGLQCGRQLSPTIKKNLILCKCRPSPNKMKAWKASLLLFTLVAWASASADVLDLTQAYTFTVTAPAKLRPNSTYTVAIDYDNPDQLATFQVVMLYSNTANI